MLVVRKSQREGIQMENLTAGNELYHIEPMLFKLSAITQKK